MLAYVLVHVTNPVFTPLTHLQTLQAVAGDAIKVHASNGGVRGEFNTSTELVIETSNAPIVVRADLLNGDERPTILRLKTSNGYVLRFAL